ncbi:hypothetical protein [Kineococcus indalonis]|uniref:hypothetical protein n=1 Tax=Kineococcus indalonis TaxID=2696566 RepID=UPI00141375FB|nr:hypothetical protein [Kineococcus indalonis]NAZ86976.1 hypothetical protein [Kineococcus indalonis]
MSDPRTLPARTLSARTLPTGRPPLTRRAAAALWALVVLGAAVNVLSSAGVLPLAVGVAAGVLTLSGVVALVVARRRQRRAGSGTGTPRRAA